LGSGEKVKVKAKERVVVVKSGRVIYDSGALDRALISLIVGLAVVGVAVFLGYNHVLDGTATFALILIGLAIAGFGRYKGRDFETYIHRAMRAGRGVEPIVSIDHEKKVVRIYTKGGLLPKGLKKNIEALGKKFGYQVDFLEHGGLFLLKDEGRLIDEVHDFHGPEYSGKHATYPAGSGPKIWKLTIWHEKFLPARVIVYLQYVDGGNIWTFDFVLREGEAKEITIPIPKEGTKQYQVTINLVAFREAPASIGYRIEEFDVEGAEGDYLSFTRFGEDEYCWPGKIFIGPSESERLVILNNLSKGFVKVSAVIFEGGTWFGRKMIDLGPNRIISVSVFELKALQSAEIQIYDFSSPGHVAVDVLMPEKPKTKPEEPSELVVMSGDEIKPVSYSWAGSLGVYWKGGLLTNAHVAPFDGMSIFHSPSGKVIGLVRRVSEVRRVSWLDILLNFLFGKKLPTNKVDASYISPSLSFRVTYKKFRDWPDEIAEVSEGDVVYSRGRTSGERAGKVMDTSVTVAVPWPHGGGIAIFEDCILLDMKTRPGDSGSAVVSDKGWVGLIFAGDQSGKIGLAIKAKNIDEWLG
jgi:hypothetical protein